MNASHYLIEQWGMSHILFAIIFDSQCVDYPREKVRVKYVRKMEIKK